MTDQHDAPRPELARGQEGTMASTGNTEETTTDKRRENRLDINKLSPPELAIVLRMRGMDYRYPMDATLSLIRQSCIFNLRTGTPETDWKARHDDLATEILGYLDAGTSCPNDILERVRGQQPAEAGDQA